MMDLNLLFSSDQSIDLLSKRSQLQELKGSCTQSALSIEKPNKISNLSHVPCKFFKQGSCTAGSNCTFSHRLNISSESLMCRYFIKGNCKFGRKCALLHTINPYGKIQLNECSLNWHPHASSPWDISFDLLNPDCLDDAMLPSSLNDLFTPSELHSRRVKQGCASGPWRVPFITKNEWLDNNTSAVEDVQFFMDEATSMENTLSALFQNKMNQYQHPS